MLVAYLPGAVFFVMSFIYTLMKVDSVLHDTVLIISFMEIPFAWAQDAEYPLTECALGSPSSITALESLMVSTSQPARVGFAAARYGLMLVIKRFWILPRMFWVLSMYHLMALTGQLSLSSLSLCLLM